MTTLSAAVTLTGAAVLQPSTPLTLDTTVSTFPSSTTVPGPSLAPGTHVIPGHAASPTVVAVSAVAMSGTATLPATAGHTAAVADTLTGTATLSSLAFRTQFPSVTPLAGTSTLTDAAWAQYEAAVTFAPNSVLSTAPVARALVSPMVMAGSGVLHGAMLQKQLVAAGMSATAVLTPGAAITPAGSAGSVWNALSTLLDVTARTAVASVTLAPNTTLLDTAGVTALAALAMPAAAVLVAGPVTVAVSSSAWAATGALVVSTSALAVAAASWSAAATFSDSAMTVGFLSMTFAAQGEFLTDLRRIFQVDPFVMAASSTLGPSILTIVKVGVAILVGGTTLTVLEPGVYPLIPPGFVPGTGPLAPVDTTPVWRLFVADTITGRVAYEVPMASMQWQSKLNSIGTAQATLDVQQTYDFLSDHDERDPRVLFRQFLTGAYRYSLCFAYGGTAVWAGPYTPGTIPGNSATVTVGASEFPYMLTKRILTGSRFHPNDLAGNVNLGPTTKADMALSLITLATSGDPTYSLPWSCPNPPPTNDGVTRTYHGYDFSTVWDALSLLSSEADGPDVRFDPQLTWRGDGLYLSYLLRIGNPLLGALTPWAWDVPVSATVQWDTNVQNMASAYYGIGSGQDAEKINALVTTDDHTKLGFPALEMIDALHSSVTDFNELNSITEADLTLYKTPAVKWTVGVQGSRDPTIGTFRCGDTFQVTINDHPVIADGTYRRRITGLSGTLSDWVFIESADDYVVQNTTISGVQTILNG